MYLVHLGFPGGSDSKESACNTGDLGSIPGSGRSPGEGNGYPLQYSCLENPMDRGAWQVQSVGSQRVRHSWATNSLFFFPPNLSSMDHLLLTNLESLDLWRIIPWKIRHINFVTIRAQNGNASQWKCCPNTSQALLRDVVTVRPTRGSFCSQRGPGEWTGQSWSSSFFVKPQDHLCP